MRKSCELVLLFLQFHSHVLQSNFREIIARLDQSDTKEGDDKVDFGDAGAEYQQKRRERQAMTRKADLDRKKLERRLTKEGKDGAGEKKLAAEDGEDDEQPLSHAMVLALPPPDRFFAIEDKCNHWIDADDVSVCLWLVVANSGFGIAVAVRCVCQDEVACQERYYSLACVS